LAVGLPSGLCGEQQQTRLGALADQAALEFGQRAEHRDVPAG
jgi:hypothetical protein